MPQQALLFKGAKSQKWGGSHLCVIFWTSLFLDRSDLLSLLSASLEPTYRPVSSSAIHVRPTFNVDTQVTVEHFSTQRAALNRFLTNKPPNCWLIFFQALQNNLSSKFFLVISLIFEHFFTYFIFVIFKDSCFKQPKWPFLIVWNEKNCLKQPNRCLKRRFCAKCMF